MFQGENQQAALEGYWFSGWFPVGGTGQLWWQLSLVLAPGEGREVQICKEEGETPLPTRFLCPCTPASNASQVKTGALFMKTCWK